MNKKEEKEALKTVGLGAAASEVIERYGSATAQYVKGYKGVVDAEGNILEKGLKHISQSKVNSDYEYSNLKQQSGFSAETHFENKTNAENIINKKAERISRTDNVGMVNDTRYDHISIDENGNPLIGADGKPVWGAQMKFCGRYGNEEEIKNSAKALSNKLASEKWERYRGSSVEVPSEQYEYIREYSKQEALNLREQAERFRAQGNLEKANLLEKKADNYEQVYKDVHNSGISSKEAMFLRQHPKLATTKYVLETSHQAGIHQAKMGAILSGAVSLSQNAVALVRKEKEFKEVVTDTVKDTAKGAGNSYIIAAGGTAMKGFMEASSKEMLVNLSKTNLPAMLATTTVQVSKSLKRYAKGEIDEKELVEELGEKGTGMMSASLGAAIGTAVFPGIGTVVGGMVGYMTSSQIYQGAIKLLQEEKLSEEQYFLIKELSKEAVIRIQEQEKEMKINIKKHYKDRQQCFDNCFLTLDKAIEENNISNFTQSLNAMAENFGVILQFKTFNEFDNFMNDENSILSL